MIKQLFFIFCFTLLISSVCHAVPLDKAEVDRFVDYMVVTHQFDRDGLLKVFSQTTKSERVLNAISKPAEALPWHKYRSIFIQTRRIEKGANFWRLHQALLERAAKEYGVPPEIIVAIIGVETQYGENTGNDRVMDSLATLAFHYPKRADFFRKELEHFLVLSRDQEVDPLSLKGSYAGAMGLPQFMPSSYRAYAVDFDGDGHINIWSNPADAIGSVANYFREHGWQPGGMVTVPASTRGNKYLVALNKDLKPDIPVDQLYTYDIDLSEEIPPGENVKVLSLQTETGEDIWLCLHNFYVITRYNHSGLYAMAVYQLAQEIRNRMQSPSASYG